MSDTRVVVLAGPRQAGKSTLLRTLAGGDMAAFTLDDQTTLAAATADPAGFIRGLDRAAIDEIQRAPELLLAIKRNVDDDPCPGRFLLTGSADLLTLPRVADSLAGRMEVARLLPLARCEIDGHPSDFLARVFAGEPPAATDAVLGDALVDIVLAGGYPEAIARVTQRRRRRWHLDYIDAIVRRDVRDIADVQHLHEMPRLLQMIALHAAQLANYSALGAPLGLNHVTTARYAGILEQLFLVRTLPAWHRNARKRLTRTPKLHLLDTGLLASLRELTPARIRADRTLFGPILESFVHAELLKLATWSDDELRVSHYRGKERHEVDIVLEDRRGRVVGIEIKASATVTAADFKGMRMLAEECGDGFVLGLVLYDSAVTVPFADRMFAAPLSGLWSGSFTPEAASRTTSARFPPLAARSSDDARGSVPGERP